jgi:diaminopimelate epimerase
MMMARAPGTEPALALGAPAAADSAGGLRFAKYTSFGNTFIVVDETSTPLDGDRERAAFARWALNGDFGIGGTDNVLYLSRAGGPASDRAISTDVPGADFLFRIFEHDGSETLSCGNGLLSTAALLHRAHGGRRWGVLTELPTGRPKLVHVGVGEAEGRTWVNVGWPRAVAADLFNRQWPEPESAIDAVEHLRVPLPRDAGWAEGLPDVLTLSGWLSFTGEPHLMLIAGHGVPDALEPRLYPAIDRAAGARLIGRPDTEEMRASSQLVDHIGRHVNAAYRELFPQGVHLNFARILDRNGLIEYRTYERAIDIETLACGSGAVAMAHIAVQLGLVTGPETTFWPHRCRWYRPDASLSVAETESGFVLTGQPRLVCAGVAPRPEGGQET